MEAGDPRVIYHAWQGSRGIVSCTAHRRRAAVSTGLPGRISNPKNSCFCDRLSIVTVEVVLLNNYTLPNYERSFLKCTPQNTIYANAQFITFEMNSLSLVILTSNRFNNIALVGLHFFDQLIKKLVLMKWVPHESHLFRRWTRIQVWNLTWMNVKNDQTSYFRSFLLWQPTDSICGQLLINARFGWGEAVEVSLYVRNLSLLTGCMAAIQHPLTS